MEEGERNEKEGGSGGGVEGEFDEMTQDRRGLGQETCQHYGRPVPLLINISIFKVTLLLLWKTKKGAILYRLLFCNE